jgi:16S rRNA (cytosine967-C5)-methyltransferase
MSFEDSIQQALKLMPRHREASSRRASSLGLDDLIDEARAQGQLDSGALDLLLMGTRYRARALRSLKEFLKGKPLKPREIEDLLVLIFASLLSRDKMPAPVQLNTFVEIAGKSFGVHLKGLVNAWGRQTLRDRENFERERREHPSDWLPQAWRDRWAKHPTLLEEAARRGFERPEAGVSAFDASLEFSRRPFSEWQERAPFQAMDPGSWDLVRWIDTELGNTATPNFLDACAAPGGKFIALSLLRAQHGGLKVALGTDSKFPRLQRLKENLSAWQGKLKGDVQTQVLAWGEDEIPESIRQRTWDLVLADLPCSGSGTLHTRPDLLDRNPFERLETLQAIQARILAALSELRPRHLFVSICSVDPIEIDFVSRCLKRDPSFRSWDRAHSSAEPREGLTAWRL